MTPELLADPSFLYGFGAGAAGGYTFATVTTQKAVKDLTAKIIADKEAMIVEKDRLISELRGEIKELRDLVTELLMRSEGK